jgi:hypothetical protein
MKDFIVIVDKGIIECGNIGPSLKIVIVILLDLLLRGAIYIVEKYRNDKE